MKILIIGTGSIGSRHARNLKSLGYNNIFLYDTNFDRLKVLQNELNLKIFSDLDLALAQQPDVVFICSPSSHHIKHAQQALISGAHIFIEKPLSNSLDDVNDLIELTNQKKKIVQVGFNLRFHPNLIAIKKALQKDLIGRVFFMRSHFGYFLPFYRPGTDYKKSYSANSSLGGGVVLDAIHEIDYAFWFFGNPKEVFGFCNQVSSITVDTEDLAEIFIRFENGIFSIIHLDYLQQEYSRGCEIIGEKGKISWNFKTMDVIWYDYDEKKSKVISNENNFDFNKTYLDEISYFFECIKNNHNPETNLLSAKKSLQIALGVKQSNTEKRVVPIE